MPALANSKLSNVQREKLRTIYKAPGQQISFISGWPTYGALENRGLVTIARDREAISGYRYCATITDAGRAIFTEDDKARATLAAWSVQPKETR